MTQAKPGHFYFGHPLDESGSRSDEQLLYEASDLTTHGIIVGMTGSGKTGLGVILLEEALLEGVPAIILDPKGDITNLMLNFPEMRPEDFEPWVNEGDADRKGITRSEHAAAIAETWKNGLEGSGIGSERLRRLKDKARVSIFTPGSTAGIPLNVLGTLAAPEGVDAETMRDEIEGFVTSLLGLAGIDADPIASREHILLANLIEKAWSAGQDLSLSDLIAQIQKPPIRKLGVFELDSFFPEKDRLGLALRLNGLVASPSFESWITGMPLDIDSLLQTDDGKPRGSVIYLAHLSEEERQFTVTLILSKLITWMRAQSGTSDLRALCYMDEVFGFAPPSANPPAKKAILTIMKQARAFGLGMVLSTQNPVDLDYKIMSNAGSWFVGRLQTERDKQRVLDGLSSASGDTDIGALSDRIGGLGKRQFLLHNTRDKAPRVFSTRWAMSYLRGPLTRSQISTLTEGAPERATLAAAARPTAATPPSAAATGVPAATVAVPEAPALAEDESAVAPTVARGIRVHYLDPAAAWADAVGAVPGGKRMEPALVARVHMVFDETRAGLEHREEWEAVFHPVEAFFDADVGVAVDYDERDFEDEPPEGAVYALPDAEFDKVTYFRSIQSQIKDQLYRSREVEIFKNPELKLYSRVGESRADFELRCQAAAEDAADAEMAKIRDRLETKMDRIQESIRVAQQRVAELEVDVGQRRNEELLSGAGALIGALIGGRSTSTKISRAARSLRGVSSRRSQTTRTHERLEGAKDKVEARLVELEEMEEKIAEEVTVIADKWRDLSAEIESLEVGLEKNDIDVAEVAVVWVPKRGA